MGFHKREIEKGELGELSKIFEEIEEVKDAQSQGQKILLLWELSDVIGAIESYLERHHPNITFEDLKNHSDLNKRCFIDGTRE